MVPKCLIWILNLIVFLQIRRYRHVGADGDLWIGFAQGVGYDCLCDWIPTSAVTSSSNWFVSIERMLVSRSLIHGTWWRLVQRFSIMLLWAITGTSTVSMAHTPPLWKFGSHLGLAGGVDFLCPCSAYGMDFGTECKFLLAHDPSWVVVFNIKAV